MTLLKVSKLLFHHQPNWHLKPNLEQNVFSVEKMKKKSPGPRACGRKASFPFWWVQNALAGPPTKLKVG